MPTTTQPGPLGFPASSGNDSSTCWPSGLFPWKNCFANVSLTMVGSGGDLGSGSFPGGRASRSA
jgi:hypothetical protein